MANYYTRIDLEKILADFYIFERDVFATTKRKITGQEKSPFPNLTRAYKNLMKAENIEIQALRMYPVPDSYSPEFSGLLGLTANAIDQFKKELGKARQSYEAR